LTKYPINLSENTEVRVLNISSYDLNSSKFNGFDWISYLKQIQIKSNLVVMYKQSISEDVYNLASNVRFLKFIEKNLNRLNRIVKIRSNKVFGAERLFHSKVYQQADVVHLQIILDGTLDTKTILRICQEKKVIWTWHDPSPTTGHCVTPMDCGNWTKNCAACPDLKRPISIRSHKFLSSIDDKLKIAKEASVIHVSSKWMSDLILTHPEFSKLPLLRLPFGLDTDVFYPTPKSSLRSKLGIDESEFVIGFRQTNDVYKNMRFVQRYLDTIEISEKIIVVTIGDTGLLDKFKSNPRFSFIEIPWTNLDSDLRDFYNALNVFISPSRFESFGFMPLEAMACGTQVIGVMGSSVAEICNLAQFGWLVQDGDISNLRHIVSEVRQREFSDHAKKDMVQFVALNYKLDKFLDQLGEIYRKMKEEN
jgi:glycosyltransferase involved in cell wall biosynthesis